MGHTALAPVDLWCQSRGMTASEPDGMWLKGEVSACFLLLIVHVDTLSLCNM